MRSIKRFIFDASGLTTTEYGILIGLMSAFIIVGLLSFYTELGGVFSEFATWFEGKYPS
jgi:Flp pilus assembly pilin Flp